MCIGSRDYVKHKYGKCVMWLVHKCDFVLHAKKVVQCDEDGKISILQQMLDSSDRTLVCTSSLVEALQLRKVRFNYYRNGLL